LIYQIQMGVEGAHIDQHQMITPRDERLHRFSSIRLM